MPPRGCRSDAEKHRVSCSRAGFASSSGELGLIPRYRAAEPPTVEPARGPTIANSAADRLCTMGKAVLLLSYAEPAGFTMLGPWMLQHRARARVLSDPFWGSGQGAFKASATLTPSHQKAPNNWKRQVGLTLHVVEPLVATRMPGCVGGAHIRSLP